MLVWLHTDKPIKHTILELHPKLGMCFRNEKKIKKAKKPAQFWMVAYCLLKRQLFKDTGLQALISINSS